MSNGPLAPDRELVGPDNRGDQKTRDLAEWIHIAANIAVILSALVVVVLYILQRRDSDVLQRQQLAAQMFQHKYDDRVMDAYLKVSAAFDTYNDDFRIFSGVQEEGKARLAEKIIADAGEQNFRIVIDYYNDLLVCIDYGLCDRSLATSLTGQDIRYFYCKARYAGLPQLRKKYAYPAYGDRLAKFAGVCEAAQSPSTNQSVQP